MKYYWSLITKHDLMLNDSILNFIQLDLKRKSDGIYEICPLLYKYHFDHFTYVQNSEIENYKIKIDETGCQ
jgi:hypothetical protein